MLNRILETCYYVSNHSTYVTISEKKIKQLVNQLDFRTHPHWLEQNPFGIFELPTPDLIHFILLFDAINFSFWGDPKWRIQTDIGTLDGSFALLYAFLHLRKTQGHLTIEKIEEKEFESCLKGNVTIPFLKERYKILKQVSSIIQQKMNGDFSYFIKDITTDIELFQVILNFFPNFMDQRKYQGHPVYFYKLAQLVTSDLLHIKEKKEHQMVDYSHLVGCADYKIPQILRDLGILVYHDDLAFKVDHKQEIKENSVEEVEIRANTIVAINKLQSYTDLSSIEVNDAIWNLSQKKSLANRPYHLTRTLAY